MALAKNRQRVLKIIQLLSTDFDSWSEKQGLGRLTIIPGGGIYGGGPSRAGDETNWRTWRVLCQPSSGTQQVSSFPEFFKEAEFSHLDSLFKRNFGDGCENPDPEYARLYKKGAIPLVTMACGREEVGYMSMISITFGHTNPDVVDRLALSKLPEKVNRPVEGEVNLLWPWLQQQVIELANRTSGIKFVEGGDQPEELSWDKSNLIFGEPTWHTDLKAFVANLQGEDGPAYCNIRQSEDGISFIFPGKDASLSGLLNDGPSA
jgi:hypothetical protein